MSKHLLDLCFVIREYSFSILLCGRQSHQLIESQTKGQAIGLYHILQEVFHILYHLHFKSFHILLYLFQPSKRKLEIYTEGQNQFLSHPSVLLVGHVGYLPFIKILIILCHSAPDNFDLCGVIASQSRNGRLAIVSRNFLNE